MTTTRPDAITRAEGVYRLLRSDILGGRLVPGERLKFPDLCERYRTSVGAAREVLTRLENEGLVQSQSHRGFTVTELSHRDLADLTEARVEVESMVLRLSIRDGDVHFEAQAVAALHLLERIPFFDAEDPTHPSDAWVSAHAAFHRALLAGCRNRRLLETAQSLRDEAELYRQWSVSLGHEPDRDVAAEHRALLEYTLARDTDAAVAQLREHVAHTARLLISVAADEPNSVARLA